MAQALRAARRECRGRSVTLLSRPRRHARRTSSRCAPTWRRSSSAQVVEAARHPEFRSSLGHQGRRRQRHAARRGLRRAERDCRREVSVRTHRHGDARRTRRSRSARFAAQTSNGMLCSARELELGVGPRRHPRTRPPTPRRARRSSTCCRSATAQLDLDVLPNRPDLLSHLRHGARDQRARRAACRRWPISTETDTTPVTRVPIVRHAEEASADGVTVRLSSPTQLPALQRGDHSRCDGRPESGLASRAPRDRSDHARSTTWSTRRTTSCMASASRCMPSISRSSPAPPSSCGRRAPANARHARWRERARVAAGTTVIADGAQPTALAGVMGGRDSEVTDTTTDILLEVANFDATVRAPASPRGRTLDRCELSVRARHRRGVHADGGGACAALIAPGRRWQVDAHVSTSAPNLRRVPRFACDRRAWRACSANRSPSPRFSAIADGARVQRGGTRQRCTSTCTPPIVAPRSGAEVDLHRGGRARSRLRRTAR